MTIVVKLSFLCDVYRPIDSFTDFVRSKDLEHSPRFSSYVVLVGLKIKLQLVLVDIEDVDTI